MIKKTFITVFCVSVTGLSLLGQAPEPEVMTLRDCMEYAVSNSTKMRIREAEKGDARIAKRDAVLSAFTPNISASTYAYYNFGRSIDPQTNTYFNTTSFHNSYGVSAGIDLFNGFSAVNNIRISNTGLSISESQELQAEADICLAVMEAYYNVVYYSRLHDIYEEQVQTAEAALKKAKRQEELGQKGHADVVQMEADLADREYDLTSTWNMYCEQKTALSDLMFWPLDKELVIDTSLPEWEQEISTEEDVLSFAESNDPEVKIASLSVDKARMELSTAKWQLLPTLGLYAGWNTSYYTYQGATATPFNDQFRNNAGEYVELALSIPIWGKLQRQSRISTKRNALKKASAEYDQKIRDIQSEVRRAIQDRDGTGAAYRQASKRSEVQEEAYNLNLKKLEQGLISPLEFQTANNNYLKAKADEMNSLFKYLIKSAVVKYYGGTPYINQ